MGKTDKMKNFFTSKSYKWILWVIAEVLLLVVVFALGMHVGLHKAKYSYQWGANYERNFIGGPHGQMMPGMPAGSMGFFGERGGDFRNAHGLSGSIVSIADNKIVVKDQDNKENTVAVSDNTIIKSGRDDIKIGDLKTDEKIVVMGKPDSSGVINADLIRVFANSGNANNFSDNSASNPPSNPAPANNSADNTSNSANSSANNSAPANASN